MTPDPSKDATSSSTLAKPTEIGIDIYSLANNLTQIRVLIRL